MAQAFTRLGTDVTVVDRADRILPKEDKDMADAVQAVLEAEGVAFHLGAAVEKASVNGGKKTVGVKLGEGRPLDLTADAILIATGRIANVADLRLEAAGVAFTPRGIPVDARLRTNQKAGDR